MKTSRVCSRKVLLVCLLVIFMISGYILLWPSGPEIVPQHVRVSISVLYEEYKKSGLLTNENTTITDPIIPSLYHYIRFNQPIIEFVEMLSIRSVLKNGNPDFVYIHTNQEPSGQYWDMIKNDPRTKVVFLDVPKTVFGTRFRWIQHASDVARIQVLLKYGGIYMDNDGLVIHPDIQKLRKHHCVVSKSSRERHMSNSFMMGTDKCTFLKLYLELYKLDYRPWIWYYNGGRLPQYVLVDEYPGLVYISDEGVQMDIARLIWGTNKAVAEFQKNYHIVHLYYRHSSKQKYDTTDYDINNIKSGQNAFSRLARWILFDHERPF